MRTQHALSCIALLLAGCSSPPPTAPAPTATVAIAPPEPATASAAATASASPHEVACTGRRRIGNMSFAPDGQSFVTACSGYQVCNEDADGNATVDVWSVAKGGIQRSPATGMLNIMMILWSPAGFLATAADPTTGMGAVRLYSTATWEKTYGTDYYCISDMAFNSAGSSLAVAGCDGHIIAVSTSTGKAVSRPEKEAHPGGDYSVQVKFSDDGKALFVDDENQGHQELDPVTLKRRSTRAPAAEGLCAAVSPRGILYALSRDDGTLTVAETKAPARTRTLAKEPGAACSRLVWFDPTRFVLALSSGAVALWDTAGKGSRRELAAPPAGGSAVPIAAISAAPSGGVFVSSDATGALAHWDLATGTRRDLYRPPPPKEGASPATPPIFWSPGSDRFAAFLGDHVTVWDARLGARLAELPVSSKPDEEPLPVHWSPDGAVLAVADGALRLLRVADGERLTLATVDYKGARTGMAGAPGGAYSGPPDLAHCVVPASVPADRRVQRASLVADFFAGKPL